jgi:transposase InsO family protein
VLRTRLRALAAQRRRFGYRRLHLLLRREGFAVNHKKLFRIYREERLVVRKRGGRKRALGMRAPAAVPQDKNQRWSLDFVSDTFGAASASWPIVDDFTRECLALVADTSLSGHRVARELDGLIARRGRPAMVVSDNGTELTSTAILRWQQESGVSWHHIAPGQADAERLRRKLQRPPARRAAAHYGASTPSTRLGFEVVHGLNGAHGRTADHQSVAGQAGRDPQADHGLDRPG